MEKKKVIIAGAGFAGATAARKLADAGYTVEVYERRNHLGGNAYDYKDSSGAYIHEYGPHIFHSNLDNVYEFLSRFTEWFDYKHKVIGFIDDAFVPIPFSLKSLEMRFSSEKAERLKEKLIDKYGLNNKVTISELKKEKDPELTELAQYVYEKVFLNYTKKQWGLLPEELGNEVTGRVPVYISYEDGYFQDKYQRMPKEGFTRLFDKMLDHENISVHLDDDVLNKIEFSENKILVNGEDCTFIYTGCIDELFGYSFGELEYRSLDFDFQNLKIESFQDAAVVNYPNNNGFTRITEFKKFTVDVANSDNTTIVREYPCAFQKGKVPYYPIPLKRCEEKYKEYKEYAQKYENLKLIGRLAEYKYYNMDLVINSALNLADKIIKGE